MPRLLAAAQAPGTAAAGRAVGLVVRTGRGMAASFLERLPYVAVGLGVLVAAVIVFPSFTPGALVQGLGITSVAVGFAFKDVLQNFFAGVLDMPTGGRFLYGRTARAWGTATRRRQPSAEAVCYSFRQGLLLAFATRSRTAAAEQQRPPF